MIQTPSKATVIDGNGLDDISETPDERPFEEPRELPWQIAQTVASWRRVIANRAPDVDACVLFLNSVDELLRTADIYGGQHPDQSDEVRQDVIDALQQMSVQLGIDTATAQSVLERGSKAHVIQSDKVEGPRPLMRIIPPAHPFPIEALGNILGNAAEAIHDRIQSPLAVCAQSVLAAATLTIQGHVDIVLPTGHRKPVSLFFVSIALTGERKTSTDTEAMAPIRRYEERLRAEYDDKLFKYQNDLEAWEAGRDDIVRKAKGAKGTKSTPGRAALTRMELKEQLDKHGPPPVKPPEPCLTCDEPTIQGLEKNFKDCLPSVGLFATEGGKFIGGHAMADEHKIRTATSLSNLWDGEPIRRLRSSEGSLFMPGRRLSMHLAVQPGIVDIMLGDRVLATQGLLSRMLVIYPDSLMGGRMWHIEKSETRTSLQIYYNCLEAILNDQMPMAEGKHNELSPAPIEMDDEAKRHWTEFADLVEKRMGRGGDFVPIAGLANKLPEIAARIAAVLIRVEVVNARVLTVEYLKHGITLAVHYASEALRTFAMAAMNADLVRAQDLLDWLTGLEDAVISLPDIYQRGPNSIRDAGTAKRLVGILENHGWLVRCNDGAVINGEKRREAWQIVRVRS